MNDLDLELEETTSDSKAGGGIDLKRFARKLLFNIHWIILSALLGWYIAKIYLRYQVPIYQESASIYIGAGEFNQQANSVLKMAGLIDNGGNNVSNQIFILKSFNLIGDVVDSMQLNIQLTNNGRIKQQPINLDVFPYIFNIKRANIQIVQEYELEIKSAGFTIKGKKDKVISRSFGETLIMPATGDTILIEKNPLYKEDPGVYILKLLSRDAAINLYQSRLTVSSSKQADEMLELSIADEYPDRAKHVLNTLIYFYDQSGIEYKNQAIQKALLFLNKRITDVSDEIDKLEDNIKDFKVENKINSVSDAANATLAQLNAVDAQKSTLTFNTELLSLVEKHIKSYDTRNEIVPNALTISDPVLASMIANYNQLLMQRRSLIEIGTANDPVLKRVEAQLDELRNNILKNIQNIKIQYKANNEFYLNQEDKFSSRFNSLPEAEKKMIQIDRQLNIKQTLQAFLLQKKEEVGVQLASNNVSNSRLVDAPRNKGIIQPISKKIYITGISIGLLLPILIIFLIQFLNKRVQSKHDVEAFTDIPIVGEINEIGQEVNLTSLFSKENQSRSIAAEQYRSLRSNLHYLGLDAGKKIVLVTSFMRDEGKSFTSLNLADILSQAGKKVVTLEFDLRKPKLSKKAGLANTMGLSNYLADEKIKAEDLLVKINGDNNSLFLVPSGPIPPNPSELLLKNRMNALFDYLKDEFDYIIIDSAPVGLVSDTFSLVKYADITLYIIRHQFSIKQTLAYLNQLKLNKRLNNVCILINGIKSSNFDYGNGYGYGYSGTNGYGYSEMPKEKSWYNLLKRK